MQIRLQLLTRMRTCIRELKKIGPQSEQSETSSDCGRRRRLRVELLHCRGVVEEHVLDDISVEAIDHELAVLVCRVSEGHLDLRLPAVEQ